MAKTHRYHTRVLVVVHSHNSSEPVHLSPDVISLKSTKGIKGPGGLSITLVPRKNYLNLVFPNDVINVYIDPGDGKQGFIRSFMGFIDRVDRTEVTDERGGVSTEFRLACTDFQKAFEKTNIYFNQHMENRGDLTDQAIGVGTPIGGITLRTLGIVAHGSPADMVENLTLMLFGFQQQWVLPDSYDALASTVKDNRQRRKNRAKARVPDNLLNLLSTHLVSLDRFEQGVFKDELEAAFDKLSTFGVSAEDVSTLKGGLESLNSYQRSFVGAVSNKYALIDLLDFSFIEAAAIDGFLDDQGVWTKDGILAQFMRSYSNEIVNELFFDLRPVSESSQGVFSNDSSQFLDSCFGDTYKVGPDELGYNFEDKFEGFGVSVPAVAYTPAIVMREYPFSCVEGVEAGTLDSTNQNPLGFVPFGPVFSQMNDEADGNYRAIYDYSDIPEIAEGSLSVSNLGCAFDGNVKPQKHLDVVTIHDTDVIMASVGRSDNDMFNLYTMYSENTLITPYKYILKNFMPLVNSVSVTRDGLRVRNLTTRFADFGRSSICKGSTSTAGDLNIRNMIRHLLLIDHWEQHNKEYLSGEITLRGMPEIRVGYRLDWYERRESYYVVSVSHTWNYPREMQTTVKVTRGQRNDPFLSYIPPKSLSLTQGNDPNLDGGNRDSDGRLGQYFEVLSTPATSNTTQGNREGDVPRDINPNILDVPPSDFTGVTIYAGEKRVRDPNFVPVPPVKEENNVSPANEELAGDITDGVWPVAIDGVLGEPVISQHFKDPPTDYDEGSGKAHWGVDIMFPRVTPGAPFIRPEITRRFECSTGNIRALAVADGKILSVKDSPLHGIEVKIDHGKPWRTVYRHLASATVAKGQAVSKGTVIGIVGAGNTKRATNHMHFEIWDTRRGTAAERRSKSRATMAIDPETMLQSWPKVGF